ncbi:sensor of ECF-type sigma factor [Polaribacter sargassicola]|uniref:sensor of ECF-type sigma factor n=1 Tax=Polaribacter sargassicola TaxID=2836891 RepID=UPI001F35BA87|nr:sensor of ECF-type sigma factor [Polaribacter sp. DS7-9]MCG1036316.1 sensor of ECF-type sigma factor [Polaribacter sp. DS7-9]
MKKILTFTFILFLCSFSINAQSKDGREKIKALKIAYLTEQLNLTSSEAQKFWPIYNSNDEKQHSLRSKIRTEMRKAFKEKTSISESEAEKIIKIKLDTDKEIYECQSKFISDIKEIISYKKIIQLQIAEMEFGRKLMNKYKKGNSK